MNNQERDQIERARSDAEVSIAVQQAYQRGRDDGKRIAQVCSCRHDDLGPNFHMTPCPIKTAYMAGIAVGRSQGRAEGRVGVIKKIESLAERWERGHWRDAASYAQALRALVADDCCREALAEWVDTQPAREGSP